MTKHDLRARPAPLALGRDVQSYLRGDRVRVILPTHEPTHCFCGRRALYRTTARNEGRCRDHREAP